MPEDWQNGGFGLYVHWPFCAAKCPYCDFNSHVSRTVDHAEWARAYLRELDRLGPALRGRTLNTVFFGGGTPSLMDPDTVGEILSRARSYWPVSNDLEVTLEANPGSVEAARFSAFRAAGINRISMGVQALNDRDLKRLGRIHTVAEAKAAFDIARAEFDRVSFDLICARQDQTLAEWKQELTEALSMAIDHLSLYQLTIEPGTAFADRLRVGKLHGLPDETLTADMYDLTQDLTEAAGLPGYEISNHAVPGAESRHNLIYWRYGDYLGIGPGAHSRITLNGRRHAIEMARSPAAWLKGADAGSPETLRQPLDGLEQAEEMLFMGMRLRSGISTQRFRELSGVSLQSDRILELTDLGLVATDGDVLRTTESGRPLLNSVISKLLAG